MHWAGNVPAVHIRDATVADALAINTLYNASVMTTTVQWTEELESVATRRAWVEKQVRAGNPVLVVEADSEVVGFASYDDFRDSSKWPGYRFTVEHTIHIHADHQSRGVGGVLLGALVARAGAAGKHVIIGAIDGQNAGSIRFHSQHGFVEVARMPELGFKFGRWLDLVLVQRMLTP
jgi:phosphinothricin acetyltransferase